MSFIIAFLAGISGFLLKPIDSEGSVTFGRFVASSLVAMWAFSVFIVESIFFIWGLHYGCKISYMAAANSTGALAFFGTVAMLLECYRVQNLPIDDKEEGEPSPAKAGLRINAAVAAAALPELRRRPQVSSF